MAVAKKRSVFGGVRRAANKLLEAKGKGYEQLLKDLVDKKNITGPWDELVKEMKVQAKICRQFGTTIDWHVAETGV